MRRSMLVLASFAGAVAIANVAIDDRFVLRTILLALLWATAGVAWALVTKAGQISLGHSAFTGISAFTFVVLLREADVSPWLGMLAGMALSVLAALLIGIPTLRLRGFYFALATAAFPLILMLVALHFVHAELAIPFHLDEPLLYLQFREISAYVWIALGLLVLTIAVAEVIEASRLGMGMRAVRQNEILASSVGIAVARTKLAAFVISAALVSMMSVIWANSVLLIVTPREVFGLEALVVMLSVAFVGGVTRTWGPVLGAALLIPLGQVLTAAVGDHVPGAETLVYGVALVAVALLVPQGLLPWLERLLAGRIRGLPWGGKAEAVTVDHELAAERWTESTAEQGAPRTEDPGLRVRGLNKRFGGLHVLRGVDLDVQPGRRVGLIGPNGAGKTTLFNAVCGHIRADSGTAEWMGRDIGRLAPGARYRLGISRTFQVPQGFTEMTPAENVYVAAIGRGMDTAEAAEATAGVLAATGLAERADEDMRRLTTLELKLLELARAAVTRPRLLMLDEPLAGLTQPEHGPFFAALDRAVSPHAGVLIIEHSVRSLVPHVEWLVALDSGVAIASGPPQEVVADPRVIASYLGGRWANTTEGGSDAVRP